MPITKRRPSVSRKGIARVISEQEEMKILDLLRNADHEGKKVYYPEMADLIEVLLDTGMRLGEALNLRYKDIDYTKNVINIHARVIPSDVFP